MLCETSLTLCFVFHDPFSYVELLFMALLLNPNT